MKITTTDAKNQFEQLMENARTGTDVLIERHGHPTNVLISYERYMELTTKASQTYAQRIAEAKRQIEQMKAGGESYTLEQIHELVAADESPN